MMERIQLFHGDITRLKVDAVVNAANSSLMGGGGVDGAIHRAAGPELLAECRLLNSCKTGDAKITKAYKLPAKYVIHTVGPVWYGGSNNEPELLANCYRNSLLLAVKNSVRTIAFPNISTGVYRFPKELAAQISISEVNRFLSENDSIDQVLFCVFDQENFEIYNELLF